MIHLRELLGAIGLAAAFAACSTTTTVEGWPVSCVATGIEACQSVAAVTLNNMAWGRPANPTGTITVIARGPCAPVPAWADGSMCFDAHVSMPPSDRVCLVVAPRPTLGGFGQVGGDEVSGLMTPPG
ncbi:MAG: hypothetical protein QOI92_355, partial [Chloroflexota bacterium]|nr:hypothetical protein [Chloroflexota bacterium]